MRGSPRARPTDEKLAVRSGNPDQFDDRHCADRDDQAAPRPNVRRWGVEVNLLSSLLGSLGNQVAAQLATGNGPRRLGN